MSEKGYKIATICLAVTTAVLTGAIIWVIVSNCDSCDDNGGGSPSPSSLYQPPISGVLQLRSVEGFSSTAYGDWVQGSMPAAIQACIPQDCAGFNYDDDSSSYQLFTQLEMTPTCYNDPNKNIYLKTDYDGPPIPACIDYIVGCRDSEAKNYNPSATVDCKGCCVYDAKFADKDDSSQPGTTLYLYNSDGSLRNSFDPVPVQSSNLLVYQGVRYVDDTAIQKSNGTYSNCSTGCGIQFGNGTLDDVTGYDSVMNGCDTNNWGGGLMSYAISPYQGYSVSCSTTGNQTGGIYACSNFNSVSGKTTLFGELGSNTLNNQLYRSKFSDDDSNWYFITYANRIYNCTDPLATNPAPASSWGLNSLCCTTNNQSQYKCNVCVYNAPCDGGTGENCDCTRNVSGCTTQGAYNYDPNASIDDGSCVNQTRVGGYLKLV